MDQRPLILIPAGSSDGKTLAYDAATGLAKPTGYSNTDIGGLLASKADTSHTHTAADITDFSASVGSQTDVAANTAARHTQNTDTGTTQQSFQIDSGAAMAGVRGDVIVYPGLSNLLAHANNRRGS